MFESSAHVNIKKWIFNPCRYYPLFYFSMYTFIRKKNDKKKKFFFKKNRLQNHFFLFLKNRFTKIFFFFFFFLKNNPLLNHNCLLIGENIHLLFYGDKKKKVLLFGQILRTLIGIILFDCYTYRFIYIIIYC